MTHFDFLFILPGLGTLLAVARMFRFLAQILVQRPAIKPSALHLLWLMALFTLTLQSWYFQVGWREADVLRHLWQYQLLFIFPFCQYVVAVILCPAPHEKGFKRLDIQLERHGQVVYAAVGLMLIATGVESTFITLPAGVELKYPAENVVRYCWGAAMVCVGAFWPAGPRREQIALALLVLAELGLLVLAWWPA